VARSALLADPSRAGWAVELVCEVAFNRCSPCSAPTRNWRLKVPRDVSSLGLSWAVATDRSGELCQATALDSAATHADETIGRIREINDHIVGSARRGGETSLEAYERLLRTIAGAQEAAGDRGAEWVRAFTTAQARFTRELADALPAAARSAIEHANQLATRATEQARRAPGVEPVEGEARGAVAREQDLPIANYDKLNASDIVDRLEGLSETDLHKIGAYERKHDNRKTVHSKIESLSR
jgi:hypothetical protein